MDPIFEEICNHSGKYDTLSYENCGWTLSLVLFRKIKETESTIAGLHENSRRYDRTFQDFNSYDNCTLPENVRPQKRSHQNKYLF